MRIPSLIMLYEKVKKVNDIIGSSLLSPAYGWSGTRATINYNSPAAEKNRAKPESKRAKRKRGVGEMNFRPPASPAKRDN